MEKKLQEFCQKYDAVAGRSQKYHRRARRPAYQMWSESDPEMFQTLPYDDIACVEIHMPEDRFRALLEHDEWVSHAGLYDNRHFSSNVSRVSNMIVEMEKESLLRHQYPVLQLAWEKYQTLLKLCR